MIPIGLFCIDEISRVGGSLVDLSSPKTKGAPPKRGPQGSLLRGSFTSPESTFIFQCCIHIFHRVIDASKGRDSREDPFHSRTFDRSAPNHVIKNVMIDLSCFQQFVEAKLIIIAEMEQARSDGESAHRGRGDTCAISGEDKDDATHVCAAIALT